MEMERRYCNGNKRKKIKGEKGGIQRVERLKNDTDTVHCVSCAIRQPYVALTLCHIVAAMAARHLCLRLPLGGRRGAPQSRDQDT